MNIPQEFLKNQIFQSKALGFNPQSPIAVGFPPRPDAPRIPEGAITLPDGNVQVSYFAPTAQSVTASHEDVKVDLTKDANGLWTGILPYAEPGFKQLAFHVDGSFVINRMAPIGFGSSCPLNYVEVPDVDHDFLLLKDVPHGAVSMETYKSSVTNEFESCWVYTPPFYQKDLAKTYPVLYLEHGGGENEICWVHLGKINSTMDNLIAEGKAVPCIIVMCAGMVQVEDGQGGRKTNYDAYEQLLLNDVIPFIERTYRTKTDKFSRAIAGLSMGSLQSARILLKHLDMFGAAGLFTGYTPPFHNLGMGNALKGSGMDEILSADYLKVLDDAALINREIKVFFRAIGDQETSLPLIKEETRFCAEKGINSIEKVYPGAHEWRVWRRAAYDFLQLIFR
jgi:enterochelin esterase-like enzyme